MKKINNILKKDWLILILIVLGFALGAYFYPSLPDRVPTHWNHKGQIDGYGSKLFGTFGLPLINLGIYLLFILLPYIDPKRKNYDGFHSTYQYLKYLLVIFLLGIEVTTLLIATGVVINQSVFIPILGSLLFISIGNVMGRIKYNYFVGIKNPWTLANEEVWRKTHRMAAPVWVIGGILNILLAITGISFNGIAFIIIVVAIIVVPTVYSYVVFQKIGNIDK
ncbi:SdpI family protein [Clostridium sp. CM028]|uniref:SdpI family protein n=1 Tax=unclassified Clostridium TaxID=2614128 RepID=UPI001C0DF83A|nr:MULTISPECIES: SdpI family protein [unclassified Clostridium]MBU3091455.1 SdpI family protein [Clostridium sp. CF011]MBW9148425.1 SdpI family protein [Clostridium sp. CM028]WAG69264.1 SdpI family protein [Clostridium sp. CF011]WLC60998.1 SdpI family protein [Clostridium sp. CM028]